MFPLPVEFFSCKDVSEGFYIHAIVMVEGQNLNMLENIFNYLSEIALSEIVEDEIEVVHFKLRYFFVNYKKLAVYLFNILRVNCLNK